MKEISMDKSALELIPRELQGVALPDADIARAVALAGPSNQRVRDGADRRLAFDDEPAHYLGYLASEATRP
jgi:hypothetical protein